MSEDLGGVPRVMALDVGDRRIGIALSDGLGIMALPLFTMERKSPRADAKWIARLVRKHAVVELVVGHPLLLDGRPSQQTGRVEAFAELLREFVGVPLLLHDERLSTRAAEEHLERLRPGASMAGRHARERIIDQVAAVLILEGFLEHREHLRARSAPPGEPGTPQSGP